jgi:integrase
MARSKQDTRLNTRSVRVALKQQDEPYWRNIAKGLAVGYRKGAKGGTWLARHFSTETGRRKAALGVADDHLDSDGSTVLSFDQAQAEAYKWHKNLMRQDSGEVDSTSYTVAQAMDSYIRECESKTRKSQARARLIVEGHIKPAFGTIQLAKLTPGKVKAWRDALSTNAPKLRTRVGKPQAYRTVDVSDPDVLRKRQATANRILTVLKAGLNYAHEHGKVTSKAAWENVKPYRKVDLPKIRFLTMDEATALIPECEPCFQSLVKAALLTGCRFGELTSMKVEAFDAEQGSVFIAESKNGESRYVDLNAEGIALFTEVTRDRQPKDTIFLRSNGKAWKTSEQKRPMDAACSAAKIEGVTFHILRHTYASHAVMNGMPIAVLADTLGHKDTRITERHYAHLSKSYKQKLVRENAPTFGFDTSRGKLLVMKAS